MVLLCLSVARKLIWITALLLLGCRTSLTPTPVASPTPTAGSVSDFIAYVSPAPNSILRMKNYLAGPQPNETTVVNGVVTETIYIDSPNELLKGSVCAAVAPLALATDTDIWDVATIVSRTTLVIDGERQNNLAGSRLLETFQRVHYDPQGKLTSAVLSRVLVCAAFPGSPGVHQATITFTDTSGQVSTFSWQFELTN